MLAVHHHELAARQTLGQHICRTASPRHTPHHSQRQVQASCKGNSSSSCCSRRQLTEGAVLALASLWTVGGANAATMQLSDEEWHQRLSGMQYRVLRKAGTELPFTSKLNSEKRAGTFKCAGCDTALFSSEGKFESGTGWPSFFKAIPEAVELREDKSIPFFPRTEVVCNNCKGHIGHVFEDGPPPTGLRYCMNGAAMTFTPSA